MVDSESHDSNADQLVRMIAEEERRRGDHLRMAEISSQRINALQKALDVYQNAASLPEKEQTQSVRQLQAPRRQRKSRFGWIMDRIRESGERGMTPAEMRKAAEAAGYSTKPNTVRSQVWHAKKEGKLEEVNGRYRIPRTTPGDETPGPSGPSASNHSGNGSGAPSPVESRDVPRTNIFD